MILVACLLYGVLNRIGTIRIKRKCRKSGPLEPEPPHDEVTTMVTVTHEELPPLTCVPMRVKGGPTRWRSCGKSEEEGRLPWKNCTQDGPDQTKSANQTAKCRI
jgi:hypothetical protein